MPSFAIVLPAYTLLLLLTMVAVAAIFNGNRNACDGIVSQHFLLTAAARSLSLAQVARMSDEEARDTFKRIRWSESAGEPVCPECGCLDVYAYACRPLWRCKGCRKQFSLTSGTLFHSRKLPVRSYLMAIAVFVNGAKGHAALHLSRDLDVQYKTAFVLSHKLREAMGSQVHNPDQPELSGTVEIDGMYAGGNVNRRTRRPIALTVVLPRNRPASARLWLWRGKSRAAPCRSSCGGRATQCRWFVNTSRLARSFMPTNRTPGSGYTHPTICDGSITPPNMLARPAQA
jgi:transposase-like protein